MKTANALDETPPPLRRLRELQSQRAAIAREEEAAVRNARLSGSSWQAIASAMGISKQAAHKRFGLQ